VCLELDLCRGRMRILSCTTNDRLSGASKPEPTRKGLRHCLILSLLPFPLPNGLGIKLGIDGNLSDITEARRLAIYLLCTRHRRYCIELIFEVEGACRIRQACWHRVSESIEAWTLSQRIARCTRNYQNPPPEPRFRTRFRTPSLRRSPQVIRNFIGSSLIVQH
jgi:hypothetical protein